MLEHIKSKYILKKIISNLDQQTKLLLVKYNKKIKYKLDIDIIDYMFLSRKYFVGERNGKGKEYTIINNKLIFEGDYIDGKKTGYGKEYYEEKFSSEMKIKYEGKYLNGKRNGKGIEYYNNGGIKFEGIFLFGQRYKGKGYDKDGKNIYELEEGKGYIKEFGDFNDIMFEGEYPNGKGKEYFNKEKIKFEGDYVNGIKWNGIGYDKDHKIIYKLKNGRGYIKELNNFGSLIFEGEYIYGKKTGYGKEYSDNKVIFDGIYLNNIRKRGK